MCLSRSVLLAVIKEAAEAATASNGPLHGYPPWLVVLVGTLVVAFALWLFAKLLKFAIWIGIIVVLVGGVVITARMLIGG